MDSLQRYYNIYTKIKLIGTILCGISFVAMMFIIVVDVFGRNFFSFSISGNYEFVQNYLMPLGVFPALAFVYSSGILPRMDLLTEKFSSKINSIIVYILLAVELFICVMVIYYSLVFAMDGLVNKVAFPAGGSLYILYPLYFLVPLGFIMITIEILFIIFRNIVEKKATLTMERN